MPRLTSLLRLAVPAAAVLVAAAVGTASAQVTLAPTFVYVDDPDRYGTVVVTNTSSADQEVYVDFQFGYPAVDSAGRRYIEYEDAEAADRFSASGWVRSFPPRFRLAPKHRQRVRLMMSPPGGLDDGVYWTRMVVTSREQTPPEERRDEARVTFEFKQVISVIYVNGRPTTEAEITDLKVATGASDVSLTALVERNGEAPFIGTIGLRLFDAEGKPVTAFQTKSETYFRSATVFSIGDKHVPPGRYTAEVSLNAERSDIRSSKLPKMPPITRRFAVEIPDPSEFQTSTR